MFGHDDTDTNNTVVQPMSTTPPDENLLGVAPSAPAAPAPVAEDDDDGDIEKIVDDINATVEENKPAEEQPDDTQPEPTDELAEIKKSALRELSPLLDELDQSAEEKLDILIMTIQATDDQSLIPQAFQVAKSIEDKKTRAEAMLDIIQEINYFTKKTQ